MPKGIFTRPTFEYRFWSKVRMGLTDDDCWLWAGTLDAWGYGRIGQCIAGVRTEYRAHRLAYERLIGPVPTGLELDHLCRVRACVRPDHLEPVTTRVNQLRSTSPVAANAAKTHCKRGHPFDLFNTVVQPDGHRNCRLCVAACSQAFYRKQQAKRRETDIEPTPVLRDGVLEWGSRAITEPT